MATRTKSIVSAAVLASTAAIAVATPVIAPHLSSPTPHALSAAKVQLATFADVLAIPAYEWTDLLFGNSSWGNSLSQTSYGPEWAKPQDALAQPSYVNPWATFCDGNCSVDGIPAVSYLFFDALVNGNDQGWDPANPGKGWSVGFVNYLFEPNAYFPLGGGSSPTLQYVNAGWSAATWFALQGTIGQAIPSLTVPLAGAFWGPNNLSVFYNLGLSVAAALVQPVPVVGPITSNSILAYLGNLEIPDSGGNYYQYGLSGVLNYWVDIATGSVPFPTAAAATAPAAAALAAAAAPAAATTAVANTVTAPETKPAIVAEAESTPAVAAPEATPAAGKDESTPKATAPESTPEVKVTESTPEVTAPESTPKVTAPESTPEVKVPESTPADTTPSIPSVDVPAEVTAAAKETKSDAVAGIEKEIKASTGASDAPKTGTSSAGAETTGASAGDTAGGSTAGADKAGASSAGADKSGSDQGGSGSSDK